MQLVLRTLWIILEGVTRMDKIDLGIDKITDRQGRCLGSRLELVDESIGLQRNELLVHAVNSLAGGPKQRKGKLVLPLLMGEDNSQLVQTMTCLSKNLRQSVVVEAHAGVGGLSAAAVTQLRGLRTMLKVNLALSSKGYQDNTLCRDIKALDPEIVFIDEITVAGMIRSRRRAVLLDLAESCGRRGARVAVAGNFSDGDQAWLSDAGADMFVGHRFGVRINGPEVMRMTASRRLAEGATTNQLDGLMGRLGVRSAMIID